MLLVLFLTSPAWFMPRRFLTFSLLLMSLGAWPAAGQSTLSMEGGARAAALGGAATALPEDAWGFANPAAWATLSGRAVSFFATQAYGLEEMRLGAALAVEPTRVGAFAAGARTFGFEDFRETHFTLGFARGFSLGTPQRLHAGLTLRYMQTALGGDYGSAGVLGVSLGTLAALTPDLWLGFHATNLNAPELEGGEELPRTLALGLSYTATDRLRVLVDGFKDVDYPVSVRAGLELLPVEALALRAGVATQPTRFSAGVGLRLGLLQADLAAEQHQDLGWTPAAALGLRW